MKARGFLMIGALVLLATSPVRAAIYADFTTSQGAFTVELDALRAPRAVANFMGLADGTQTWRDPATGAVRGVGNGDGFYRGMRFYATEGGLALLGGLRPYSNGAGSEYWEGPGYTILDETSNGVGLARGVLALAEFEGPHSGGGELALMLANTSALGSGWTGFGAVTGAGMAVVAAIAYEVTNGSGRVEAQIAIRDEGATQAEQDALAAARSELPAIEEMPLGLEGESHAPTNVVFWSMSQSQACLSTTSNLVQGSWSVLPGTWNTGSNAIWKVIPVVAIPGVETARGFLHGSQAVYPTMTASLYSGKMRIAVAHTGWNAQFWLDFTGGTGIWARVENGIPVESGLIGNIRQQMETANSICVAFPIGLTMYWYWLGFDQVGATTGRFYCEQWYLNADLVGTDSGTFEVAAGWGVGRSAAKASELASASALVPTTRGVLPSATLARKAIRSPRTGPGWVIGGENSIGD